MTKRIMNKITTLNNCRKSFISNRSEAKKELNQWINSTFITIIWLIIFLFIYYLWTLNANATMWYDIRELESQISQLKSKRDTVVSKIANLKSWDNIDNDTFSNKDMVEISKFESLIISDNIKYVYNN